MILTGKHIIDYINENQTTKEVKLTPEQQELYDRHYDKLSDRGGMTHQQIHSEILKKLGIRTKPK